MRLLTLLILAIAVLGQSDGVAGTAAKTAPHSKAGGDSGQSLDRAAPAQDPGFIAVSGSDLKARLDGAFKLAAGSEAKPFWVGYSFAVRPGVAIDTEIVNGEGKKVLLTGTNVSLDSAYDTRNLGVFFLYLAGGREVTRVEIYNLDHSREFGGQAVYWLGRAGNEESFDLLTKLIQGSARNKVAESATIALAMHDDVQVNGLLERVFRESPSEAVRRTAIFWLGQGNVDPRFFAEVVLNEGESTEVRKRAAFAIGAGKDRAALATLRELYDKVTDHQVKMHIIFAASVNGDKEAVTGFLTEIARNDDDGEAKKLAEFWLGQKSDSFSPDKFSLKYKPPM